jgi:hypothetical protein
MIKENDQVKIYIYFEFQIRHGVFFRIRNSKGHLLTPNLARPKMYAIVIQY